MTTTFRIAAAIAALLITTAGAEARHRHHHSHSTHHRYAAPATRAEATGCVYDNNGRRTCAGPIERTTERRIGSATYSSVSRSDVRFIPNPPGTWRVALSCAHRLAAYWGLGKGLDAVSEWKHHFARASGPGPGIAAVRYGDHHIMGVIGGAPGGYDVVDFNSGGHLNREYTVANFSGYYFLDTRTRLATR